MGHTTFWKDPPAMATRDQERATEVGKDKAESAKVRKRSKGRCEVIVRGQRCTNRAGEVHHHIGGWKLRGRGESALAKNKTHACTPCHRLIEGNVLKHIKGNRYRRVA